MPFKRSGKPQMGSTKLREDRDATSRKNRPTKEPVAAFFKRAKRGVTEEEIRGMISDFEAIGPMPSSGDIEELRGFRQGLYDWYFTAVSEALSLTPEQKQAARASLAKELDQRIDGYKKANDHDSDKPLHPLIAQSLFEPNLSFHNVNLAPWNLCDLTENQERLTNKQSWQTWDETLKKKSNINWVQPWLGFHSVMMHNPETGEIIDYPPPSVHDLTCTLHGTIKGGIIDITTAFPLIPDQKLADHRKDLLAQAKLLHPAQLRMALLMNPGVVHALKHQLENLPE